LKLQREKKIRLAEERKVAPSSFFDKPSSDVLPALLKKQYDIALEKKKNKQVGIAPEKQKNNTQG